MSPTNPDTNSSSSSAFLADSYPMFRSARIGGARLEILIASSLVTIPMVVLTAVFLCLVVSNDLKRGKSAWETWDDFQEDETTRTWASSFHVKISATKLLIIASVTSTIAPLVSVFAMLLLSYHIADLMEQTSSGMPAESKNALPTPYQLNLLLNLRAGGFGGLSMSLLYWFRRRRENSVRTLNISVVVLTIVTVLCFLVFLADTWLHITTSTVPYTVITVNDPKYVRRDHGRTWMAGCEKAGITIDLDATNPCNQDDDANENLTFGGLVEAYRTLSNTSSRNAILFNLYAGGNDIDNSISAAYLMEANPDHRIDFQASTIAASTRCQPIFEQCGLKAPALSQCGTDMCFNCSSEFSGQLSGLNQTTETSQKGLGGSVIKLMTFLSPNVDLSTSSPNGTFHFALGAEGDARSRTFSYVDPDLAVDSGRYYFILDCNTTMHAANYTWTNGTMRRATLNVLDPTVSANFLQPINAGFGKFNLENGPRIAAVTGDTTQEIADMFARTFSKILIGTSASMSNTTENTKQQFRFVYLVTSLPKAPFAVLVTLNLLYVAVGIALTCSALFSESSKNRNTQARMTVTGLIATCFEGERAKQPVSDIDDLFAERDGKDRSERVGIAETRTGGWYFVAFPPTSGRPAS
ncbi:hypothetical protein K402DRAFT_235349 [Aulographum hederae CBS 113979]|uniref:Uncharacterized protein n=1 Tax=Aulographum hederae CBS 113979 TaxID=1176131 RepID=A0A6G1GKR7_9PEZI|nr:hypothetical protein K402DRAFT_235349 [Aulographum hederae CBS 113979]